MSLTKCTLLLSIDCQHSVVSGYLEVTEELATEGLETCLHAYNYKMGQKLNLVFFRQAMLHTARLSRVLAMPGGHGVLIGLTHSTGRTTLVRLASFVAHCKVSTIVGH